MRLFLSLCFCWCSFVWAQTSEKDTFFVVKGVDALQPLVRQLADEYMKLHPKLNIEVEGGGAHTSISCLNNGIIDVALSNRPLTKADVQHFEMRYSKTPIQIPLAKECLSVFVNYDNPVSELSIDQVFKIYRGEITNWQQVGGKNERIALYSMEDFSDTYLFFKKTFLAEEVPIGEVNYFPTWDIMISQLCRDKNGIGYGPGGIGRGLKKCRIKRDAEGVAVTPSLQTAKDNTYPVVRTIYAILREPPQGNLKGFIDWLSSAIGREVFVQEGFYADL